MDQGQRSTGDSIEKHQQFKLNFIDSNFAIVDRMIEDIGRMRYQNNVFGTLQSSHDSASDDITSSLTKLKRDLESMARHHSALSASSVASSLPSKKREQFKENWRISLLKKVAIAGERLIKCQQTIFSSTFHKIIILRVEQKSTSTTIDRFSCIHYRLVLDVSRSAFLSGVCDAVCHEQ